MSALLVVALLAADPAPRPRLVVLDLTAVGDVEPAAVRALTDTVTIEASRAGIFHVTSVKEIETAMGIERQKQMMGCGEESSCLAELAGALGARFVMSGGVARLGAGYQLTLQTLDTQKVQPLGRSTRVAADLVTLQRQVPIAVADATASPRPSPASRLLPYSLMGLGALAIGAGAVVGYVALSDEAGLSRELELGTTRPGVLRPPSYYDEAGHRLGLQKTLSLVGLIAGAALLTAGIIVYRLTGDDPGADGSVSLVAVPGGAGLWVRY